MSESPWNKEFQSMTSARERLAKAILESKNVVLMDLMTDYNVCYTRFLSAEAEYITKLIYRQSDGEPFIGGPE